MKITESQRLNLAPELLWPWLADPSRWPQWNRKIKDVRRSASGPLKHGESFTLVGMLSRAQEMQAEVVRLETARRLVLRCRYEWHRQWRGVTEDWKLKPEDGGTRLRHISDLRDSGIPTLARWLIWLIRRIGRPVGPSTWARLEQVARSTEARNLPT